MIKRTQYNGAVTTKWQKLS